MMRNNDHSILQDLTSAITALETLCNSLQQEAPDAEALAAQDSGLGLLLQWQKLFGNHADINKPAAEPSDDLADMLRQQLARLKRHAQQQRQQQQTTREQLLQAACYLQDSPFISEQLTGIIHQLENKGSPLYYLQPLLECYQQALTLSREQQSTQHELCQRLLQLIDELDYHGEIGNEIHAIQQQLLTQHDHKALPAQCLRLIELIIEGNRNERRHSARFLALLNDDLQNIHNQCSDSVTEGKALIQDRQSQDAALAHELNAINIDLTSDPEVQLALSVASRIQSLKNIVNQHQRLQQRESALLNRLTTLEDQVSALQEQASDYQRKLLSQNEKLMIDSLTQIYNRAALDERLKIEFERWKTAKNPLAVVLLDIDYFKHVNDKYGHLAGDKALRLIARTLRESTKESDFVARFGGEEFVILMLNVDPALLHRPLQQLLKKIESIPFRFKKERVTITASIGATLLKSGDTITSALERADQALYRAKNAGRNQLVIA
ncbi:GGDEF domain-containing protein [Oceanimonas smirnovii]|uniref:GGDEF domain-containing protein n=1 Tax=Oceanimonas smirnovii TaxID=264574 RepID=UPI000363BDC6|nr:GGDEF domain-containing protein [Oceanimonas smirnovii]